MTTYANVALTGDNAARRASISPLRTEELMAANQLHANATHRIITRHWDTPTAKRHYITEPSSGRTFEIIDKRNIQEADVMTEFIVKEAV
jgi:hypothetical protein